MTRWDFILCGWFFVAVPWNFWSVSTPVTMGPFPSKQDCENAARLIRQEQGKTAPCFELLESR